MKTNNGFNLIWVIVIIIVTAITSSIATGVVMLNNSYSDGQGKYVLENDKDLVEFINVYKTLLSKYYDNIDKSQMLNKAEEAMLKFLDDKYTTYLNNKEYKEIIDELSGEYNRIGITIDGNKVLKVAPLSSSSKAGILKGDLIVSVNDVNTIDMSASDISLLIKNIEEKELSIKVLRDDNYYTYTIEKDNYPSISYLKLDNTNIGYIYIKTFSQNLSEQVSLALKDLESKDIKSLIIDVRDNVGGYLSSAEDTASLFLEKGKVIYSLESNNNKYTYKDETAEKRDYPIVVLINNSSASASEILAASLKDSYNAILVGNKSYGKGKVQQIMPLENGDTLKYTSAKWLTPNNECIDGIGLIPKYSVTYEENGIYDSQILKAMELLQ